MRKRGERREEANMRKMTLDEITVNRTGNPSINSLTKSNRPVRGEKKKSHQRPGPNALPILQWKYRIRPPRQRVHRTYTREFKLEVLSYWLTPSIRTGPTSLICPTQKQVAVRYLVPESTIKEWKKPEVQERIVDRVKGGRRNQKGVRICRWPEMEEVVYQKYGQRRDSGKAVRRPWRVAYAAFEKCYSCRPEEISKFAFSNGWFYGFLARHHITLRLPTNKSQKIPSDYLQVCLDFMRFNRRNSQIRPGEELRVVGRYLLSQIGNVDETPLPFEFLDGQTYADKGSHSVKVRSTRSGWDKRQGTIIFCICADGAMRVKPLILYKGVEVLSRKCDIDRRAAEMKRYDPRVLVKFNPNAYANESVLVDWITDMLAPVLPAGPRLLALDVAKFHKTDSVLDTLRSHNIVPSMVPAGCTGLVQPLDVAVNKPVKDLLRELIERRLDDFETASGEDLRESSQASAVEERRVLVQRCVAEAWEQFCTTRRNVIVDSFRKVGLSLPIDGSCDDELSIKGIDKHLLKIGDWRRGEGTRQGEIEGWGDMGGPGDENVELEEADEVDVLPEIDFDEADDTDLVDKI